jgi:hypothetical protein
MCPAGGGRRARPCCCSCTAARGRPLTRRCFGAWRPVHAVSTTIAVTDADRCSGHAMTWETTADADATREARLREVGRGHSFMGNVAPSTPPLPDSLSQLILLDTGGEAAGRPEAPRPREGGFSPRTVTGPALAQRAGAPRQFMRPRSGSRCVQPSHQPPAVCARMLDGEWHSGPPEALRLPPGTCSPLVGRGSPRRSRCDAGDGRARDSISCWSARPSSARIPNARPDHRACRLQPVFRANRRGRGGDPRPPPRRRHIHRDGDPGRGAARWRRPREVTALPTTASPVTHLKIPASQLDSGALWSRR